MILIQEVAPKRYNLYSPEWTLALGKEEEISGIGPELNLSVDAGLVRQNNTYMKPERLSVGSSSIL